MVTVFLLSRTKRDCFFSSHTFLYNDYQFHTIPWRIWPLEMLLMLTIEKKNYKRSAICKKMELMFAQHFERSKPVPLEIQG